MSSQSEASCFESLRQAFSFGKLKINPLLSVGNKAFFDEVDPKASLLIYSKLLKKYGRLSKQDLQEFKRILKFLPNRFLHPNDSAKTYSKSSADLTTSGAFHFIWRSRLFIEEEILNDPSFSPTHPALSFLYQKGTFATKWVTAALVLTSLFAIASSTTDSWWDFPKSDQRQFSYQARDAVMFNLVDREYSLGEMEEDIGPLLEGLYLRINSEFNSIQQMTRNQPVYLESAILAVENNLYLAELIEHQTGENMTYQIIADLAYLYTLEIIYPDLLGNIFGERSQQRIDNAFGRYDPDGVIRDLLDKEYETVKERLALPLNDGRIGPSTPELSDRRNSPSNTQP